MAAIIELKYFNTFWLKKIKTITDVLNDVVREIDTVSGTTVTVTVAVAENEMNVGQQVSMSYTSGGVALNYSSYIISRAPGSVLSFVVKEAPAGTVPAGTEIAFGKIINFDQIPAAYGSGNVSTDWLLEESRIRGGYNNVSVDYGVKAYTVEDTLLRAMLALLVVI